MKRKLSDYKKSRTVSKPSGIIQLNKASFQGRLNESLRILPQYKTPDNNQGTNDRMPGTSNERKRKRSKYDGVI